MPIRDLAEVGARLEETVRSHPDGDPSDPVSSPVKHTLHN